MEKIIAKNIDVSYIDFQNLKKRARTFDKDGSRPKTYGCWYSESFWSRGTPVVQMFKIPEGDMSHVNATWQANDKWMDCSLTLEDSPLTSAQPSVEALNEWRTHKIIKSIHIKRIRNAQKDHGVAPYYNFNAAVDNYTHGTATKHTFSIVQVKKSLIEKQLDPNTYPGSEIENKSFWSKRQLIDRADLIDNHFCADEINLTNLHYNLPADEDLVLINHVTTQKYIITNDTIRPTQHVSLGHGLSMCNTVIFEIVIHYI